jgi:ribosomal protein S8
MEKQEKKRTTSQQEQRKRRKFIYFSEEEKRKIIEEMLERDCTKQEIWGKYTGRKEEHGSIIEWMRELGYIEGYKASDKNSKFAKISDDMEAKAKEKSYEILKLEKRIEQLEKRLKEAEMKEVAYNIMVEIIKEEYGIDIKKNTVSSGRIYER